MAPIVHGLEAEYSDRMNFIYLDIDDNRNEDYKRQFGYRLQPHFFLLDAEGNILQQWLGLVQESEFRKVFDESLK